MDWTELFLGTLVDLAWPVAAIVSVVLLRAEIKGLVSGVASSWTKARMKVVGQEVEFERDAKSLEATLAASVLTTGVADTPETIGPPPNQDMLVEGTGKVTNDTSTHATPSPEELMAWWASYLDMTESKIIELAAQSPKVAIVYAVSQVEMVLARKYGWPPTNAVRLSTAVPMMKNDARYNPVLVQLLENIDRMNQDVQSADYTEDPVVILIPSVAKLPRVVFSMPSYAPGTSPPPAE